MPRPPAPDFGKRRSALPDMPNTKPGPKRSNHVALLVMGTLAVGGGAYALMPRENCQPPAPGMATPNAPQPGAGCVARGSSGGSGGGYSRSSGYSFFGGSSSAGAATASSTVSRGGFGSFGRAFSFGSGS
jgi:hypothetical protein